MDDTRNAFRAGLVVIAGLLVGGAFFVATRKSTLDGDNSNAYYALLEDASGINAKSLITVAGLQVGEIEDIRLERVPLGEFAGAEREALEAMYRALATPATASSAAPGLLRAQYLARHAAWVQRFGATDAERAAWEQLRPTAPVPEGSATGSSATGASDAQEAAGAEDQVPVPAPPAWEPTRQVPVARVDMRIIADLEVPVDSWLKKESLGVLGAKALFLELGESDERVAPGARIPRVRSQTGLDALQNRAEAIVASLESIARKVDRDIGGITQDVRGITQTLHRFIRGDLDSPPLDELYQLVMGEVRRVATSVDKAVRDVDQLLVSNDASVSGLLQNLHRISEDVAALTASGGPEADGNPSAAGDLRRTMAQVRQVTDDLATITGSLRELVASNDPGGGVEDSDGDRRGARSGTSRDVPGMSPLQQTLGELNRSLTSLAEVSAKVERGEGAVGKLLTDPQIANKLEGAVNGASDFVAGLTSLQTHVDLGTWYNVNEGTARVTFGLRLQPKRDKFYLFEVIEDGGGIERLTRTFQQDGASGDELTEREVVRQYDNSIRISAMFAKRFWDFLVLRAGLIETSGGIGANLYFFDERIELRSDLFNFSGPRNKVVAGDPLYGQWAWPRWRTLLKVQPVPYVYLTAGVDDVLNFRINPADSGYGLDYFFGAGITFQDEDLRSILPFVPSF